MKSIIVLAPILALWGCGGATVKIDETSPATSPAAPVAEATQPNPEPDLPGRILRADLDAVLAGGPAALLSEVVAEPAMDNGVFVGFRITEFMSGAPPVVDLRPGDVILTVNGKTVERPENYFEVFQDLKTATALRFEVLRKAEKMVLEYPIVEM